MRTKPTPFGDMPLPDDCFLCGSVAVDSFVLDGIGISIGMGGDDYAFCDACLEQSAHDFWRAFVTKNGYTWPLVRIG